MRAYDRPHQPEPSDGVSSNVKASTAATPSSAVRPIDFVHEPL
jgi:hypothetical protein